MTKEYKTIEIPNTTRTTLDKVICDVCGAETGGDSNWAKSNYYKFDEVTIERRYGERYPEGSSTTEQEYDICPECFEQKIVPFLKGLGAEIQEKEIDY